MQKGFIPVLILIGILVLVGIAGGAYYLGSSGKPQQTVSHPQPTPQPTSVSQPSPTDASPAPNGAGETTNWKTYKEDNYKFLVRYPETWIITSYDYKKFPVASSDQQQLIVSFANKISEGITLGDKERIEINIAYVKPKVSFNEFLDQRKNEAEASVPKPVEIIDSETVVSEISARQIIYKYKDLTTTFVYIPKDGSVYLISNAVINEGKVAEANKLFNQILSTFRFIP